MPRTARSIAAGGFYHVLNRGNGRNRIFHKDRDYLAFCRILCEGLERYPVNLLAWCLMPNHWHLLLQPTRADAIARLMGWTGVTHVRRHHEHYHSRGGGHLYQGRYKSFPIQDDVHFRTVCRYVEANPKRSGIVKRAENWQWSSLATPPAAKPDAPPWPRLSPWPVSRPADWLNRVNQPLSTSELEALQTSVNRGRPFGDDAWVATTAKRLNLGHTLRDPGRPKKKQATERAESTPANRK
jgi:putative transposase